VTEKPSNDDVRAVWNANAQFWDMRLAHPGSWQQTLIFPAVERLLDLRPGEAVLEIACGSGLLAERMLAAGARVVAFDFSREMVERARARVPHVDVRVLDATDPEALRGLGDGSFDAAVASMALMDVSDIGPLAAALPKLLVPGGRFVFCVTHPAFNNLSQVLVTESEQEGGEIATRHSVKVSRYAHPQTGQGIGIQGQPAPQWYFDRSLSDLLRPFLANGFVLDALEEPVFDPAVADANAERMVWTEIPPVLAARMRLPR